MNKKAVLSHICLYLIALTLVSCNAVLFGENEEALEEAAESCSFSGFSNDVCPQNKDKESKAIIITNVTSSKANGRYEENDVIDIIVTFIKPIYVTGVPVLELETGQVDQKALYFSGSGSQNLIFRYTVQEEDSAIDLDYKSTDSLKLNGGDLLDDRGIRANLLLAKPSTPTSLSNNKNLIINDGASFVETVTSLNTDGAYKASDSLSIQIVFSNTVNVTGLPQLELETGATDRKASYTSGSGSNTLTFTYTVQAGDTSSDLAYTSTSAFTLNSGTIKDSNGNDAHLTLPTMGTLPSLSGSKSLVIDTTAPTISNVTSSTANGRHKETSMISLQVTFDDNVIVTGTPQLELETGATDRKANYTSGSGSNTLTFTYTVQAGDTSSDLAYTSTSAFTLNSGTIKDSTGNNAHLTLPPIASPQSLSGNKALVIDTTLPTITNVTSSTSDGTYGENQALSLQVTFDDNVIVTGTPQLELETGATDRKANYTSGSGSNTLTFTYTTQAGDTSSDLAYTSTSALTLNAGTIKDPAGNNANLTLPTVASPQSLSGSKALAIDTIPPTISNVTSSTANGRHKETSMISLQVTFDDNVTVTGLPQLELETGATDRKASYTSGSGSNTLTFTYTVQAGDTSSDLAYTSTSAFTLNSGTIKDSTGNNAHLTLPPIASPQSLSGNKALVIDTTLPTITNVTSSTSDGTYGEDQALSLQVTFDDNVIVTGTPQLKLETGATDRKANYTSGSGSNTLTFTYTVQAGDTSSDLAYTSTSALTLNAGTIKDPAGNNANLTLPAVASAQSLSGNKALVVDTTPPIVTNVTSSTANATYGVNQALSLQVTFNDSMTVTGTPQLELETGATDRKANYTSGSGSSTLTFTYTVQPGDTSSDLAYTSTSALTLNSGTIKGPTGNNANLTLPAVASAQSLSGSKSLVVDAIPPTVLRVSSPTADGTFNTGESITIEITFNESLIVTGTPQLNLETGTIDQTVNYVSGSGSDTLSFTYTTQGGDTSSDLAYTSTSALTLNSGTIKDPDGNDASLTLPIIGSAQSLSGSKALVIDTVGILDQTDDDAAEFNSGNHTGTHFKNNVLTIDHQNESGELDASWTPQYNNIVAYWKMNGDFQDSIGTNHGTAQGGVTTTTDSHLGSEAGAFDGIQDYIATPLTIGTTVSISQWVSTTDLSSSPMLWRTGPIGIGPDLFIQRGTISLNTWDSNSNPYCSVPSFLTNGRFHHLVTVIDGTANTSSLYINGELCGNASYRDPTSTSFTISGGTGDPVRYEWNGKMDDVVAWNSSLSASEVQTIYNRQVKKYNTAELHESWTPKWSNLVGYWKMDEGSWNGTADEVKDSSGNGNHGVRVGDATTTSDAKVGSGAGTFDGSGDYILVDHSSDLDNLSQITVATWVKFGAEASWDAIICKRSTSRTFCLARDDTGGGYQFHITNSSNSGATAKSTSSIVTNEWKFVVGTYDGSEIKIYVNGVLETTTPQTGQIKTNTGHLAFALEGDNLTYPLNGSIDEVSIWNTELSSDDIALIYSRQSAKYSSEMKSRIIDSQDTSSSWDSLEWLTTLPFGKELPSSSESSADGQYSDIEDNLMDGLVGLWHFNEQSANTAPDLGSGNTDFVDYSGNSLHGDENGNISFGENGKFARGVIFDGVDDYIEMPNSIEPGAGNFSLSMWFKTNSSGVLQDLYSDIGDPILNYMYLSIEANNQLGAFVRDEDGDFVKILNRGPEVNDGLWHHVVMIRDDTKLSLYLDGVFIFEVSNANLGVVNLASGSSKPKVGSVFSANSRFFNGSMDELSIWSRALSSSEVTQLYRRGANRIKYQVRTCSSSDCSDQDALTGDGWIGPGGNHLTYFSELYNNSSTTHSCTIPMPCMESELTLDGIVNSIAPSLDFADFAGAPDDNRYFQYRVILESDDEGNACSGSPCLPEIKSITVGPEHTYFK